MIQYQFTRCDLERDPDTQKVIGATIGLTASTVLPVGPFSAYVDAHIILTPQDEYTAKEMRTICIREATNRDWFDSLEDTMEAQAKMPIPGPTVII